MQVSDAPFPKLCYNWFNKWIFQDVNLSDFCIKVGSVHGLKLYLIHTAKLCSPTGSFQLTNITLSHFGLQRWGAVGNFWVLSVVLLFQEYMIVIIGYVTWETQNMPFDLKWSFCGRFLSKFLLYANPETQKLFVLQFL